MSLNLNIYHWVMISNLAVNAHLLLTNAMPSKFDMEIILERMHDLN